MLKRLMIIMLMLPMFFLVGIFTAHAASSNYIVGSPEDMPEQVTANVAIDSVEDQESAKQSIIDKINNGGHVVIAGGTGGAVTAAMVESIIAGATSNTGGSITIVAGIDSKETKKMLATYLSGGKPVGTDGTGDQETDPTASTYGYPAGFTGTTITGYNYGQSLLTSQAPGNTTGGYLNWSAPVVPIYVTVPKAPKPHKPSIVGSILLASGYPGQSLTITAILGSHTSSGKASDGIGPDVIFNSSGNKTYTIPATAKIGQVITITFYASNGNYTDRRGNKVSVFAVNPISVSASANPTSLAPTESTNITALTTGFVNKVSAQGKVFNPNEIPTVPQVAAGDSYTITLRTDGTVTGVGRNQNAQLGMGDFIDRNFPTQISGITNVSAISAGSNHTLFLKTDGTVWGTGSCKYGQLGLGTNVTYIVPTQITGISGVKAISAGDDFSVFLKTDGTVWTTGRNTYYQLGTGYYNNIGNCSQVAGISGVSAIAAGGNHVIMLKPDGTVWGMGRNDTLQLGLGDNVIRKIPTKIDISGVSAIAAGGYHSSLLKSDGTVWAMGHGAAGQLGIGYYSTIGTPTNIGISRVKAISASEHCTIFLKTDGTVWATGTQIINSITPIKILGITEVSGIDNGFNHIALLKSDGTVWAMGDNSYGQLGNGNKVETTSPTQVLSSVKFSAISSGTNHSVLLKLDGTVWAMGNGASGQLGIGNTISKNVPTEVVGVSEVSAISAGWDFTMILKTDGTVWAMGDNSFGQLGLGDNINRYIPTKVTSISDVKAISAGDFHTEFLKTDGTVWAMGYNNCGQLGLGDNINRYIPTKVTSISDVKAISAGGFNSAVVKTDGTLWIMGYNSFGQLGLGDNINRNIPTKVTSISDVKAISVGGYHSAVVKTDGTLWTMGYNIYGELGLGDNINRNIPTKVPSISDVIMADASSFNTALFKTNGSVWNIGCNESGQLGLGDIINRNTFTLITRFQGVIDLSIGSMHTLALKSDGSVIATGRNSNGELGIGNTINTNIPTDVYAVKPLSSIVDSSVDVEIFNLTPSNQLFPSSNTWTGVVKVPYYAPVGSQFIIAVKAQSSWSYLSGYYPSVTTEIILDIDNTITIGNPTSSKTTVNPGDVITITVPTSNGYALEVKATGPNPSGGTLTSNLSATTSIATIPKTNTWSGTYTIPTTGMTTGSYVITVQGSNGYFTSQTPSTPKYLTLIVGSPSITLTATVNPDPVYSHWDGHDIVTLTGTTTGAVNNITPTVQANGGSLTILPDLTSLGDNKWSSSYQVPPDLVEDTTLTFGFTAFAKSNTDKFVTYAATTVKRNLIAKGIAPLTAIPGQVISLAGSSTDGHANSLVVTNNQDSNELNLSTTTPTAQISNWTGYYTVPINSKIGQTITLTWTPTDTVSGKKFSGKIDRKTITVSNTPQIIKTVFNQVSPYPGAVTGAPTGKVDAIIVTTGWVNSLNVSWDTSYNIPSTSYVDIDSNGTRQWTVKGLTVPLEADVSNVIQTKLNIQAKTPFIDISSGSYQLVTGTAILEIANEIVSTAQQLTNPVVIPGTPFTVTVNTTGFATVAYAKKLDGTLLALTPSSAVSPTIPYSNVWTGSYTVPAGTISQTYQIPVYAVNKAPSSPTFVNQPDSNTDYVSINIGGVLALFSASLNPYEIDLPAATEADRTVTLNAQTTGPVSGVQVSLSINGGTSTILPVGIMTKTSGTTPGLVNWQGSYLVDSSTADGTILTFTFQAKDTSGIPTGPTITPHYVTIIQTRPPKVIITH